jgi:hypothetical protein
MVEICGNVFDLMKTYKNICIPTNGNINNKKIEAVMGAGVARQAKKLFPGIEKNLAYHLIAFGNKVGYMGDWDDISVYSFPTKTHWFEKSSISLIVQSAIQLMELIEINKIDKILLPAPGCGCGGLKWENVRPEIENILDDKVYITHLA